MAKNTNKTKSRWSEKDIQWLTENYTIHTDEELGDLLGRTKDAIERKRNSLNLFKSQKSIKVTDEIQKEIAESGYSYREAMSYFSKKYCLTEHQVRYAIQKSGIRSGHGSKFWTEEEEQYLKEKHEGLTTFELAKKLGRTPTAIYKKKNLLGLKELIPITRVEGQKKRETTWREDEMSFLRDNLAVLSYDEIADHLKRSRKAVMVKATKSGLIRYASKWTAYQDKILMDYSRYPIYALAMLLERTPRSIEHRAAQLGIKVSYRQKSTSCERVFITLLEELDISYKTYVKLGDEYLYEADFVLDNLVFEINGDYWHGNPEIFDNFDLIQEINKEKDKIKKEYFESLGYRVFYVWEYNLRNDYEQTKKEIAVLVQRYRSAGIISGELSGKAKAKEQS